MAERRRRRRLSEEEESGEEVSEDVKNTQVPVRPSECESEDEHLVEEVEVSDYESVTEGKEPNEEAAVVEDDEEEEDDDDDDGSEEESESDSDEESESSSEEDDDDDDDDESDGGVDYADDADGLEEERQSGDGEEQPGEEKDKELDDDEDRRNPAYVPRRGAFYEHDTRITEDAEKERLAPKKKLWKDEGKWQHDRFHEDQQAPKSREELMVIYGYDILARDQPPPTAPRINKSRVRNPQRRQQLKDFMGDPQWSGRRTSPDVQQKNYRNRRPARSGGRSRTSDYGDSRREYGERHEVIETRRDHGDSRREYGERHEVIETRRDHGDVRRDYIDNRGDPEENRKAEEVVETRGRSSENCHVPEESKVDADEKVSTDGHHYKREFSENSNEFSESKKDHFEKRRDYVDNRKESGNNRRDSGDNRRDYMDNNRRDYSDTNTSGNVSWKVHNSGERSHSNGEVKSNNSFRGNHKSVPPRSYTNANYRGETSANNKTDSEKFSLPAFKKSPETNSNYKNIEPTNYRNDARSYKSLNHETSHRNHIIDNRGYRKVENHSGHSYRNHNENKHVRTPERNFSPEEVHDSLSKQKGAILNNIEFSGSVVTANNSMEKKSYSKERRIKGMARTRIQPVLPHETAVESERNSFTSDKTTLQQDGKLEINTGPSKVEHVTRPKRYSTQRQRNLPEVNYPDQIPVDGTTYYSQNFTQGPQHVFHPDQVPPTHQEGAAFQPTMLQAHTPIPYTLPVSTPGLPSPPRMFGPAPVPVSIATAPSPAAAAAMLPPQYLGAGVIYGAPPPVPYQVPVIPGYQSPPPPQQPTSGLQELYRGGTTYYSTDLQQPSPSRSPVRRQKSAIPIINPQDVKTKESTSANDTESSSCSHDNSEDNKTKEEPSIASSENVVESAASAERINHKESAAFDTETSADADGGTSCASSASASASAAMVSKEASPPPPPPSEKEERETNHKPVDLADTCTSSEQATQPILEAAA